MWSYLSPFQMAYEAAKPYKTPEVTWMVPTAVVASWQDWTEAIAAWDQFSEELKQAKMASHLQGEYNELA
jgi:hypothetical protein